MLKSQRLLVEKSEKRQAIAALLEKESLTDEERAELDSLTKRMAQIETEYRAAVTVEGEPESRAIAPDAEHRERIELRGRASVISYLRAAMQGRLPSGAEAELQAAASVPGTPTITGIPLELWDVPTPEQRAITPAPGTVGINLDRIRPAVFANSIAPRLGIEMPRVMSGTYASATITTSQTAAAKQKSPHADAAAIATAGAFTVQTASPKRISARMEIAIEDVAAVGQANFESILRENLSVILSDQLDGQAINGDGAAPNLAGIFSRLTPPTDPGTIADFDEFAAAHAGGIDGLWSNTLMDVGIVIGPATMTLAARTFQSAASYKGEMSAAAYAMAQTGGLWTNKRMPDAVSTIQQAILYRKGRSMLGGDSGAMRTAVCPHWNEISIDDIYSGSASGVRAFTMHVLLGDVILVQPDAYAQVAFKVA